MSTTVTVTNPIAVRAFKYTEISGPATLYSAGWAAALAAAGADPTGTVFTFPTLQNACWTTGIDPLAWKALRRRLKEDDRFDGLSGHRSLRNSIGVTNAVNAAGGVIGNPYYILLAIVDVGEVVTITSDSGTEAAIAAVLTP